ncbi:MAG: ABC transporter permease subunit, partial [Gammaproteobacteria bacterium]|nr:ABC transporter permease subunit [Gammaproteobacteria bacterium]
MESALANTASTPRQNRFDHDLIAWLAAGIVVVACFIWRKDMTWLLKYPVDWVLPVSDWINTLMQWFTDNFKWLFRAISALLDPVMKCIQSLLSWLPWPATIAGFAVLAYVATGLRLAIFTALAMLYMVITGYWDESMNTLALVFVSIPMAVGLGFILGLWAFKSERVDRFVQPLLDLMQTVPTFAYLIPILLLFGFGPVVGLVASAIYACPPMVRNMILGLQRVPSEVIESGTMSGATKRQLFWWVRIPTALPTIMVGVNQTTMAALSMVIIAAIIGSSADIGWEVLSTMRKAQFGQSLLAGIVIALIAMIMDRISRGFTDQQRLLHDTGSFWHRHRYLFVAIGVMTVFTLLSYVIPVLRTYPNDWVFYPADSINATLTYVTANYPHVTDAIKKSTLFYFLLPVRIGLESSVRPFSWGFELTPAISWSYAVGVVLIATLAARVWSWRAALAVGLLGGIFYFGLSNTPWPAFMLVVTLLAWQVGGWRVGSF